MLTKDKKPFTYTPGMGGKLDLSQIRSPRMARRVAKNANDEGIEGPPKSALEPKPTPPPNTGASLFVQPQVAIPVFPTNVPVQPSVNRTLPTPPANRTQPTSKCAWRQNLNVELVENIFFFAVIFTEYRCSPSSRKLISGRRYRLLMILMTSTWFELGIKSGD